MQTARLRDDSSGTRDGTDSIGFLPGPGLSALRLSRRETPLASALPEGVLHINQFYAALSALGISSIGSMCSKKTKKNNAHDHNT